jgi:hypothetical protein
MIQGQAISEDGEYDIPKVIYHEDEVPTTSPSKPTRTNTPPLPPSAPLPPPSCPPPLQKLNGFDYTIPFIVPPSLDQNTKDRKLLEKWLDSLPFPTIQAPPPPPPRQKCLPLMPSVSIHT